MSHEWSNPVRVYPSMHFHDTSGKRVFKFQGLGLRDSEFPKP